MALRPRPLVVATALFAAFLTAAVIAVPGFDLAYRSPSLHIALEVTAALVALLAAYLVYTRSRDTCRLDEVLLVGGLALMAASNLFFAALPATVPELGGERFATWGAICGRLLSAAAIALSAWLPRGASMHPRVTPRVGIAASAAAFALITVLVALARGALPEGVDPALAPSADSELVAHPVIHAVQLVALVFFATAAAGFARCAAGFDFNFWVATACVFAAFARVHYFLDPTLYSEWVYTGDLFRLCFYVLLVVGAGREISAVQRRAEAAAVLEERRRLARDLHDGVAQELGYISLISRSHLQAGRATAELEPIASAAGRAVDEARRAIAALTRPVDEPLDVALAEAVEDVAQRYGARVRLDLEPDVRVEPKAREELLRIAREAVANAARHAQAEAVRVELRNGEHIELRIDDDGVGFDPKRGRVGGHGLTSMRERARALGGELRIESSEDTGTAVAVVVPRSR